MMFFQWLQKLFWGKRSRCRKISALSVLARNQINYSNQEFSMSELDHFPKQNHQRQEWVPCMLNTWAFSWTYPITSGIEVGFTRVKYLIYN